MYRVLILFFVLLLFVLPVAADSHPLFEGVYEIEPIQEELPAVTFADLTDGTLSINPISPSDTSGLKSILLDLLGDYDAIIVEYTNGNYTSREVFPDYVWCASFILLVVIIYCLFRLLGGWISSKR